MWLTDPDRPHNSLILAFASQKPINDVFNTKRRCDLSDAVVIERNLTKSVSEENPVIGAKTKPVEECRFSTIVWMGSVEQIVHHLFLFDDRVSGIG